MDRTSLDLLGLLKSWMPLPRGESSANESRDFWMPDQSCRVCYECDSLFTLFNRRHHCRLCGRVFCAKCTSNSVPAPPREPRSLQEECEKVRVCHFCFKQWQQAFNHAFEVSNLDSNTFLSAASFISIKSSETGDTSSISITSVPHPSVLSPPRQSAVMESSLVRQDSVTTVRGSTDPADTRVGNPSTNQFSFSTTRSYDEDDEYGIYQLDSQGKHYSQTNGYFSYDYDDMDKDYGSRKVHPNGEAVNEKSMSSLSSQNNFDPQASEGGQQIVKQDITDEFEASSSLYAAQDVNLEPVDFESNGILWLPPEPEDEREGLLFDDDDDGDTLGEWGYLQTSSSFGSGEYRGRDRSNEEQKKVVKNVVDGHFRALVSQLMQVEKLVTGEEDDKESWLEIVTSLSWEAATLLKPDTSKGGGMDPGGYVKVKCIASGRRTDSAVVKGVVCKKNVAHRRMTSKIEKARILILEGALEYQRVSNHLSSFATLLQQEMDHLKMAVAKIDAHSPDVLLVEKSVSRYAQEYLLEKDISLVLNIKKPVLERIARCTGGQIVPSIDHLSSETVGYCDMFHVEKFLEEHGTAGENGKKLVKTLMYFEDCPMPLGCTILLRGANGDELKKVKRVVQYSIFAAYHLALETSFLADEGASLPELPLNSPITVTLPDKTSTIDRSISTIPGFTIRGGEKTQGLISGGEQQRSNSAPPTDLVKAASICAQKIGVSEFPGLCTAQSTLSSFCKPSLDHESDRGILDMVEYSGAKASVSNDVQDAQGYKFLSTSSGPSQEVDQGMLSQIVQNDCNAMDVNRSHLQLDGKNVLDESASLKEEFLPSPSDNQSILVSLSSRCVWKGTVCERSHLFRIKYYGNFDKPLGRFLRDHLFDQSYRCRSCDMPSEAHVQCYTHRQGTLTISVKKLLEILLPGEKEGKIWMWHRCLRCPRDNKGFPPATQRVVMSDAAWGLSFGKFLELSFSNHAAASRVASCGHSLHRDCLRFYGFGMMVACFRYASIDVHSVRLPPSKLDFNYVNQEWIQHEVNQVIFRAELLFAEVLNAIRILVEKRSGRQLRINVPEARRQISDLEGMLQKEKAEFEESLQRILMKEVKKGQSVDILEINRLRRQLLFQSYVWDHRLVYADSLDDKSHWINRDVTSVEPEKPLVCNDKSTDLDNRADPSKWPNSSKSVSAILKAGENGDEGKRVSQNSHVDAVHQESVIGCDADCGIEKPPGLPVATKSFCVSHADESILQGRRALSKGQFPNMESLSDTLEAAWTGETTSVVGVLKGGTCKSSEPLLVDTLTTGSAEKVYTEDHGVEEQSGTKVSQSPLLLSSKGSENMEDVGSWLGMPFISFYRTLNKNFLPSAQKLDPLGGYNPVYISSFRETDAQTGARLLLPVGVNDTVIPVYDDEPTSIISYALASHDYHAQVSDELEKSKDATLDSNSAIQSQDYGNLHSSQSIDEMVLESYRSLGSMDESILSLSVSRSSFDLDPVSYTKTLHARVSFADDGSLGKVKYSVTCYYAKRFDALRRMCCPSEMDFIRSLSRCKKWGAQGGKSEVFFAKTLDDRFIIKQVTKTELESFMKFAPAYFKYISESLSTGSPTCLAKILGIYQVSSKHLKGGKESKMDVLVMENLLFGRNLTRLYDLKGSARSRYNPDTSGSNKVLLDQNLIEAMPTSPIFVGNKAKRLLERAVWNDTAFLALVDVMDYSLLVGIDEEKNELVLGIIDFMRQYTWDKHLETWVKASGILGGPKNASPTIISPKQYKKRFRKAMTTYFLMVPDQWSPPSGAPSKSQTDLCNENMQGG
ncbi:1-phosphatidylinositol-3-phosphate 5-kinase FAB1B-like isoform X1 [Lycium ferocissimum]|uniref:1-phosphatidylinositol-3-phosphate 5-kinase FAB1B-like isoform X1 n=2 Tax=Lycium ferocissimum TaxID=112874 RepID=UPI0028156371|nr:1-phosphatidylinositol-3-phosphate 5-kinase FAB1B-like isoform X1 [Lycium ferocissimum]XP_059302982.1 1-phosphatidylinositol-3-phosphate 5-kinase FAB1B-like isoform X1 [Lycium ferocissimum]